MALSIITVDVQKELPQLGNLVLVEGTLEFQGAPETYAIGGLTLGAAAFAGKLVLVLGTAKPRFFFATGITGIMYQWDLVNSKLMIREIGGAELAAAGIPATVSDDHVSFIAHFDKLG